MAAISRTFPTHLFSESKKTRIFAAKTVNMDADYIGRMVLFHRKKSGMSRIFCAELAGVGKTVLYDIEHGKSSVQMDTLLRVLHVLNIKIIFSSPLMPIFESESNHLTT